MPACFAACSPLNFPSPASPSPFHIRSGHGLRRQGHARTVQRDGPGRGPGHGRQRGRQGAVRAPGQEGSVLRHSGHNAWYRLARPRQARPGGALGLSRGAGPGRGCGGGRGRGRGAQPEPGALRLAHATLAPPSPALTLLPSRPRPNPHFLSLTLRFCPLRHSLSAQAPPRATRQQAFSRPLEPALTSTARAAAWPFSSTEAARREHRRRRRGIRSTGSCSAPRRCTGRRQRRRRRRRRRRVDRERFLTEE